MKVIVKVTKMFLMMIYRSGYFEILMGVPTTTKKLDEQETEKKKGPLKNPALEQLLAVVPKDLREVQEKTEQSDAPGDHLQNQQKLTKRDIREHERQMVNKNF